MPSNDSLVGKTLGSYQIQREIGRGGMGVVYLAHDSSLSRRVAIKVLNPSLRTDAEYVRRFMREARSIARLRHPNIVRVFGVENYSGQHLIVMEYVDGEPLSSLIKREGPLTLPQACSIARQVAAALAVTHENGIVHRDMKPDNILIDREGVAKVTDFGLARDFAVASQLTRPGAVLETPAYMAPEQCLGLPVDTRCDIYALGVTFFEMLTGTRPFDAPDELALMYCIVHEPFPTASSTVNTLPKAVDEVLGRMTATEPSLRFESARDAEKALLALERGNFGAATECVRRQTAAHPGQQAADNRLAWLRSLGPRVRDSFLRLALYALLVAFVAGIAVVAGVVAERVPEVSENAAADSSSTAASTELEGTWTLSAHPENQGPTPTGFLRDGFFEITLGEPANSGATYYSPEDVGAQWRGRCEVAGDAIDVEGTLFLPVDLKREEPRQDIMCGTWVFTNGTGTLLLAYPGAGFRPRAPGQAYIAIQATRR